MGPQTVHHATPRRRIWCVGVGSLGRHPGGIVDIVIVLKLSNATENPLLVQVL